MFLQYRTERHLHVSAVLDRKRMNANLELCFQAGCEYMLREFSTKESKIADLKVGNEIAFGNNYQTEYVMDFGIYFLWTLLLLTTM